MTDEKPNFVLETFIRCSPQALWDALTDPAQIAAHHFAAEQASGAVAPGETLELHAEGMVIVRQKTLALDPLTRIEMTFEPLWGEDRTPSRIVYRIAAEGAICRLTCEHYGLPDAQRADVTEGWAREIAGLKTWLEMGEPMHA